MLRWLPTVLTVCTPEEGWRTKNELFVSDLGPSSWHWHWRLPTQLGFLFHLYEYSADCSHSNKQSWKNHFLLFSTYLLFFSGVSLGKISWNSAVLWKRFRTIIWTNEKIIQRFLKNLTISYFWLKKEILGLHFVKRVYCEVGIFVMKSTDFHKISPKETREKWACVFFVCMFVTYYNFETRSGARVPEANWRQWPTSFPGCPPSRPLERERTTRLASDAFEILLE